MPELPEVEIIVNQLKQKLTGQEIMKVEILRPSQWKQNDPAEIPRVLTGKKIAAVTRRAKFIVVDFEDDYQLLIHLRMTGKLIWSEGKPEVDKYTRTIFFFQRGSCLQFNDTRALGTLVCLDRELKDVWKKKIGLEPLDKNWTIENLIAQIKKSKLDAKSFLLDQSKIAGIGNIYASEILFRSGIKPDRRVFYLSETEIHSLFKFIPQVLQLAIDNMGTSLGDGASNYRSLYNMEGEFQKMIMVYGREGEACFKCGAPIIRIKQKGRSSYFCEGCQN